MIKTFQTAKPGRAWEELPEKVAMQLNDTHPSIGVAELMRILMDDHGLGTPTLRPPPSLHPPSSTLNPQPSTPTPSPSTYARHPQPDTISTPNHQPWQQNLGSAPGRAHERAQPWKSYTMSPKLNLSTLNLNPRPRANPQPQPKPSTSPET